MARNITQVGLDRPIVDALGKIDINNEFSSWVEIVTDLLPKSGNGSPEGIVFGVQGATYYDLDGATGTIIYVKMLEDIGTDKKQGWVLA